MDVEKHWKQQVKEEKVKQLLAKEAGYVRKENKYLQHPTKEKTKTYGWEGKKGPCYFELNKSFENPNMPLSPILP